ncbi:hypothetical protein M9H77_23398 [Catharanthus roseus]|uniref:Uncharacterized protein n=1 Tax=Catharanthus roseus TaxID=4058 RepID=A0ACC0AT84_CATRO|nr:hypothetical protein M9H77_23398 [Catharanthus roseus]
MAFTAAHRRSSPGSLSSTWYGIICRHCNRSRPPLSRSSRDRGTPQDRSNRGGWRGRSRPSSGRERSANAWANIATTDQRGGTPFVADVETFSRARSSSNNIPNLSSEQYTTQRLHPSDRTSVSILPTQDHTTGPVADPSNLDSFLDQNISTAPHPVAPNPVTFIPAAPSPSPSQSTEILGTRKSTRIKKFPARLQDFDCNAIWKTSISHSSSAPSSSSDLSGTSLYPMTQFVDYRKFFPSHRHFLASVDTESEPTTYSEAVSNPLWCAAMRQEIDALEKNGTWSLTSLSPGKRALRSKWVFRRRHHRAI